MFNICAENCSMFISYALIYAKILLLKIPHVHENVVHATFYKVFTTFMPSSQHLFVLEHGIG